jgi:hypothetical protein
MWGAVAPTKWRSAKSAPPRQASTQLPESPSSRPRVRSEVTGGAPLRPAGYRAHLNRRTNPGPSLTLGDRAAGRRARSATLRPAAPVAALPAAGSATARRSQCPRARHRCAQAGKVRAVICVPSENAYTDGTADSSSSYRLTQSAVPTVPAGALCSSPPTAWAPAAGTPTLRFGAKPAGATISALPRSVLSPRPEIKNPALAKASLRVARPLLALRLGGLRYAPSSLRYAPEPPLAGSSPCAGPSPRRGRGCRDAAAGGERAFLT